MCRRVSGKGGRGEGGPGPGRVVKGCSAPAPVQPSRACRGGAHRGCPPVFGHARRPCWGTKDGPPREPRTCRMKTGAAAAGNRRTAPVRGPSGVRAEAAPCGHAIWSFPPTHPCPLTFLLPRPPAAAPRRRHSPGGTTPTSLTPPPPQSLCQKRAAPPSHKKSNSAKNERPDALPPSPLPPPSKGPSHPAPPPLAPHFTPPWPRRSPRTSSTLVRAPRTPQPPRRQ